MRISLLSIKNFGPFRGEHRLALDARAYAVTARRDGDVDSSNGAGKTYLVEAIGFALYGEHRAAREDGFITEGESECVVSLHFDDSAMASRSRKRGQATRLVYVDAKGGNASGEEAQRIVLERVGLDADDYRNTAAVLQKQAHRFVTARPEDRMRIVGGWLRLDRLEACAAEARRRAGDLAHRRSQLEGQLRAAEDAIKAALGEHADAQALAAEAAAVEQEIIAARAELAVVREKLIGVEAAKLDVERAAELAVVTEQGKRLKAQRDALDPGALGKEVDRATAASKKAAAALAEARREHEQRRKLAGGQFDGQCPVAGIACPATAEINGRRAENEQRLADSADTLRDREEEARGADRAASAVTTRLRDAYGLDVRLETLRDQAKRLKASLVNAPRMAGDALEGVDALRTSESALQDRLGALARRHGALLRAAEEHERATTAVREVGGKLEGTGGELATLRAAAAVFGRNGAQRRVAEDALQIIEAGANELLADAGVDLRVAVRWSREGNSPAKACEECGSAFPASVKVKACERCGATRGAHQIQKLDVELSDRSGALDDLGGFSLQLGAWRWLRAARGSAWGVLVVDELTASLDKNHRRAFARNLPRMLAAAAAEQAFVVAHDPAVLESLPGKIRITMDGEGYARAEVEA